MDIRPGYMVHDSFPNREKSAVKQLFYIKTSII